jgi:ParB-like chromosome segregation protein Spo0J
MTQPHIESTLIEYVEVSTLITHPRNARDGDIGAIITSIQQNGWFGTVVAQKSTRYILAGNHRFQAARQVGLTHVPVFWVDCDDERALAILIADNRTSDIGRWDEQGLIDILSDLQQSDMLLGTGYDSEDLAKLLGDVGSEQVEKEERLVECPKCGERFSAGAKGRPRTSPQDPEL